MILELYGTFTSPYVRRVRAVAHELSIPVPLVDTSTDDGQAAMRAINPLWKIPTARLDEHVIFDSHAIVDHLVARFGGDRLVPHEPSDLDTSNVLTAIDGALDSLINAFYLVRDGVSDAPGTYVAKQRERAAAAMTWLEGRVDDVWITPRRTFGLPEIILCTTLGWMRFRDMYPVDRHPGLMRCLAHHDERPCLASTRPPA